MPKCLCLLTELRTIPSKSKLSSSCWFLILNIIISVLLGLNFTSQVSPHFFILFRSILIIFFKVDSSKAIWTIDVSSAKSLLSPSMSSAMSFMNTKNNRGLTLGKHQLLNHLTQIMLL